MEGNARGNGEVVTLARELVRAARAAAGKPLPDEVVLAARLHLVDAIGVGLAAAGSPIGAAYRAYAADVAKGGPATATFTFDTRDLTVWLDTPADGAARAGELCERHVRVLTPPQGWHLEDRRGARARAAKQLEATLDAHSPMLARAFQNAGAV